MSSGRSVASVSHSGRSRRAPSIDTRPHHYAHIIVESPPRSSDSQSRSESFSSPSSAEYPPFDDIEAGESASRHRHTSSSRHSSSRSRPSHSRVGSRVAERPEHIGRHSSSRVPTIDEQRPPPDRIHYPHERPHERTRSVAGSAREGYHRDRREHRSHRRRRRDSSSDSRSTASLEYNDPRGHARHEHHPFHHRAPPPPQSPPWASPFDAYPPSMNGGLPPGQFNPFNNSNPMLSRDALVRMPRPDHFGYPSSAGYSHPFSPISPQSGPAGYFDQHQQSQSAHHPYPPHAAGPMHGQRPGSFASVSGGYPGTDLVPSYYGGHPYGGPPPGAHPHMNYYYNATPSHPAPAPPPPSTTTTDPPKAPKKERDSQSIEVARLQEILRKHEEDSRRREEEDRRRKEEERRAHEEKLQLERQARKEEQLMLAQLQAEKLAREKELAQQIADQLRKEDIAAAEKKVKDAAEAAAAEKAKKAKEESDKKLEEATKKHADAEKAKKALEEEAKKNKPSPDDDKPPILFKDAMGRKFNFPWKVCKTWKGTEALIRQAFFHVNVDGLNVRVLENQYDILGPDGDIILPGIWDSIIQPGWEISMHMWPEPQPLPPMAGFDIPVGGLESMFLNDPPRRSKSKKDPKASSKDDKKKKRASTIVDPPMMDPMRRMAGRPPPPPMMMSMAGSPPGRMMGHMAGSPPGMMMAGSPPGPRMGHMGPLPPPMGHMAPPPPPMDMPGGFAHMHGDPGILPGGIEIMTDEIVAPRKKTNANTKAKAKPKKDLSKFALWAAGGSRKR